MASFYSQGLRNSTGLTGGEKAAGVMGRLPMARPTTDALLRVPVSLLSYWNP